MTADKGGDKKKGTALAGTDVTEFERFNGFTLDPDEVHFAPKGDPLFDPRSLLPPEPGMVLNIRRYGPRQPCEVRRRDGKLFVTAGHQRVISTREANRLIREDNKARRKDEQFLLLRIRVIVVDLADDEAMGVIVATNVRIDDDIATTLAKVQQLQGFGQTPAAIAVTFGKATKDGRPNLAWVNQHLALLRLSAKVLALVTSGKLSVTAGASVAQLPAAEQFAQAEAAIAEGSTSVRAVSERVKKARGRAVATKAVGRKAAGPIAYAFERLVTNEIPVPHGRRVGLTDEHEVRSFLLGLRYATGLLDDDERAKLEEVIAEARTRSEAIDDVEDGSDSDESEAATG